MQNIENELRAAIIESGQSRNAVARATGLNVSMVSRFMSGERGLTLDSASRIAEALGLRLALIKGKRTLTRRR